MIRFCVVLTSCKKKVIVRPDWILIEDTSETWNWGIKKSQKRKFFYSPTADVANFGLPIKIRFDENEEGCYEGFVLQTFGKYI